MDIITSHFRPFVSFTKSFVQKIKIFEKKKKTSGYIITLHLDPKNHNHLMYSSLKKMSTALQVILAQFLPFYSNFIPLLLLSFFWGGGGIPLSPYPRHQGEPYFIGP